MALAPGVGRCARVQGIGVGAAPCGRPHDSNPKHHGRPTNVPQDRSAGRARRLHGEDRFRIVEIFHMTLPYIPRKRALISLLSAKSSGVDS